MKKLFNTFLITTTFIGMSLLPMNCSANRIFRLKTAFIYNLTKFVAFPAQQNNLNQLHLCIDGADKKEYRIFRDLNGKQSRGRAIKVIETTNAKPNKCDIIYSLDNNYIADKSSLYISDDISALDYGADISFKIRRNRLIFVVDKSSIDRKNIVIDSRLMSIVEFK